MHADKQSDPHYQASESEISREAIFIDEAAQLGHELFVVQNFRGIAHMQEQRLSGRVDAFSGGAGKYLLPNLLREWFVEARKDEAADTRLLLAKQNDAWSTKNPINEPVFKKRLRGSGNDLTDNVNRQKEHCRVYDLQVLPEDVGKTKGEIHAHHYQEARGKVAKEIVWVEGEVIQ